MNKLTSPKSLIQWLIFLSAMLFPLLVIRFFPHIHHVYDLSIFRQWAEAWELGWQNLYINCKTCNYPLLGSYVSGGWMASIDIKNVARAINRFRYYLALVDALNVLAIWFILTRLQIKNAPLWAGIIGLLPSSWIGSSVWGQIDGVGQFLILLFFSLLIVFNIKQRTTGMYFLFLAVAGILLFLMLLTKQLIYFSMVGLGFILTANIILYSRSLQNIILSLLTVSIFVVFPLLMVDSTLQVQEPYLSHLHYILATGSQHGDIVSSLGLNMWSLFARDILDSSHLPLRVGGIALGAISSYSAGIFLFLVLNACILALFVRDIRRQHTTFLYQFNVQQLLSALMYFAMVNITFNLTLTGTHERYLFHFFPFVLIALLGWQNRTSLIAVFAGALLYGAYLYGYLGGFIHRESQSVVQAATVVHLFLFVYLFIFWVRNSTFRAVDMAQA